MADELPDELTTRDAELRYNVSRGHLTHLAEQGAIAARRIGPVWLLQRKSVEKWIANRPKRGGYRGRKAHRQQEAEAGSQIAEAPPAQPAQTAEAPIWLPIDKKGIEGHLQIDALEPGRPFYDASLIGGSIKSSWMKATIHMRPYGAYASVYTLDKSYDRLDASTPGRMGRIQEQRGKQLLALLEKHMRAALQAAGWHTEERAGNELWRYAGNEASRV